MRNLASFVLAFLTLAAAPAFGAEPDSTAAKENSAIFFNASSDSKPREVSLGLPTNNSSAVQIFEDGLPVSYYIYHSFPYKSWHGGASASTTGSIGPMETAMRYGEINNYVDSYNKIGSEKFGGALNYTFGIWGQHKVDFNIAGPIAGGWQYSLSTYQNFDPGSNHIATPYIKDRHQFYKAVISKSWPRGTAALVYQYVDYMSIAENYGPFIFVGDGSVLPYNGFDLGKDSYRPDEGYVSYMDFLTGEMKTMNIKDANRDKSHHLTLRLDFDLGNGVQLNVRSRFKHAVSQRGAGTLAGIDDVTEESGYTFIDGSIYTGLLQKRMLLHFDAFETSWINNAELSFSRGNHDFRAGLDYCFNHGGTTSSSSIFSHEVCKDPKTLLNHGEKYYNYNTGGEYYNGYENKVAAYFKDSWSAGGRLMAEAFLRLEGLSIHGKAANNIGEDTSNTRYSGFNLTMGKITHFSETYLNGALGAQVTYRIVGGLSAQADATATRIHSNIFNYGGFYDPSTDPTDTYLIRGGFAYKNDWINLLSQLNYIHQSNYNTRSVFQHVLQKEAGGYPAGYTESVSLPQTYGISSLGWVTDAMITPAKGLSFHVQFTLRNPKYENFIFSPTFSDGVTEYHDFSGKNVTNLHKVEVTFDPSYSFGPWRIWLNTRYISKQYINKTNSLYFKGRVETFGGADYRLSKKIKLSLNIINLLNQKGASGRISSADLVEDASIYKNYVMSGTFIRPFTVEMSVNISF